MLNIGCFKQATNTTRQRRRKQNVQASLHAASPRWPHPQSMARQNSQRTMAAASCTGASAHLHRWSVEFRPCMRQPSAPVTQSVLGEFWLFLVLCFPKAHASQSEVESPWTGKMFHQIFQSSTECIPLITDKESAIRKKFQPRPYDKKKIYHQRM